LGDFTGGHTFGAGHNQKAKDRETRFVGERAQGANN
jgi:hypothetical protein